MITIIVASSTKIVFILSEGLYINYRSVSQIKRQITERRPSPSTLIEVNEACVKWQHRTLDAFLLTWKETTGRSGYLHTIEFECLARESQDLFEEAIANWTQFLQDSRQNIHPYYRLHSSLLRKPQLMQEVVQRHSHSACSQVAM